MYIFILIYIYVPGRINRSRPTGNRTHISSRPPLPRLRWWPRGAPPPPRRGGTVPAGWCRWSGSSSTGRTHRRGHPWCGCNQWGCPHTAGWSLSRRRSAGSQSWCTSGAGTLRSRCGCGWPWQGSWASKRYLTCCLSRWRVMKMMVVREREKKTPTRSRRWRWSAEWWTTAAAGD